MGVWYRGGMAATEQSGDPHRDYGSPATWGDVECVRLVLETQMARMETRLTRWIVGVVAAGVAVVGVLLGILEIVR